MLHNYSQCQLWARRVQVGPAWEACGFAWEQSEQSLDLTHYSVIPAQPKGMVSMQINAVIRLNQPPSTIHCFAEEVWMKGALLNTHGMADVPDTFELLLDGDIRRSCQIVWRSNDRLGIAFLNTVH